MITFQVENSRTSILGCGAWELAVLDAEARYPTAIAIAQQEAANGGKPWTPPGAAAGESGGPGWDGWVRLLRQPVRVPPWFPTGLLGRMARICDKMRIPYQVEDRRQRPEPGEPREDVVIPLRDYQEECVQVGLERGRGVAVLPPRAGKTRTFMELMRRLALPVLWTAPTDRIVSQTVEVASEFFGPKSVAQLVGVAGADAAAAVPMVFCTAATAARLPADWYLTRQVLAVDEVHHAAALKTYHEGVLNKCGHIFHRYAMTGTFYRSGYDLMALHAAFSEVFYEMTPADLMSRGHLVPTRVVFVPVTGRLRVPGGDTTFTRGHGKYGIHEHKDRNAWAAHAAWLLARQGKRVLMLVGTKRQGRLLVDLLRRYVDRGVDGARYEPVEFLTADEPRSRQRGVIDAFCSSDAVRILIGTSLLGEGVDLPTADAMVYARGEKAEVTLVQNAYRVGTASPGKREAIIVDFADRHQRHLAVHGLERLRVYHEEPTFTVEILQSPTELEPWIARASGTPPAALGGVAT